MTTHADETTTRDPIDRDPGEHRDDIIYDVWRLILSLELALAGCRALIETDRSQVDARHLTALIELCWNARRKAESCTAKVFAEAGTRPKVTNDHIDPRVYGP